MERFFNDVRYAFRSISKAPGFFSLVIAILALGIAASVSVFSLADGVLLRPLPYRDSERIVALEALNTKPPFDSPGSLSYADYEQIKTEARSFDDIAATYRPGWSQVSLKTVDGLERIRGSFCTANLFALFGRPTIAGRVFTADEDRGREHVVVVSQGFAEEKFGSPRHALGQSLEFSGGSWRIIGVMPADFRAPFLDVKIWAPVHAHPDWNEKGEPYPQQRTRWDLIARLRPGVPLQSAQAEIDAIEGRLAAAAPDFHERIDTVHLTPLREYFTGRMRGAFAILCGAVGCLMLIVCTNVGAMLLARSITRDRELAIRASLGAARGRLVAQVLTENVVMSVIAGVIGALVSPPLVAALKSAAPSGIPRLDQVSVDLRVLAFAMALSVTVGIVLGVAAAWRITRRDPGELLGGSGRSAGESRKQGRSKNVLMATELALAMVLVTGTTLLVRSFVAVMRVDPGFRPEHVLDVKVALEGEPTIERVTGATTAIMRRIAAAPGVQAVGNISNLFFLDNKRTHSLRQVEGRPPEPTASWRPLVWAQINGDYFQAMGIPLVAGRYFTDGDRVNAPVVVIVNETLARRYWPGENPIGKRLKGWDPRGKNDEWLTVVGEVKDTRSGGLERAPFSQIYEAQAQNGDLIGDIVIRTAENPAPLSSVARAAVREADPGATVSSITTLEDLLAYQTETRRFQTWLVGVFATISLALAALGVFAMMHYTVAAKQREIGIRIAIGAQSRDIVGMVLKLGVTVAAAGIAAGALGGVWAAASISNLLYGIAPADPASFAVAAAIMLLVTMAACFLPAVRASRVDPLVSLRQE